MPRCPLCASARITVVISRHRRAFCSDCGARWVQDGSEQHTIKRIPKYPYDELLWLRKP